MDRKLRGEGDFLAYAEYAVPGKGKIKILNVIVIDSDGNLVQECGGFHLVEVSEGRITPRKIKQFVQAFTEAYLDMQGVDIALPLENIRLKDRMEMDLILGKARSMRYDPVRGLR
jgi:hypothetical protein